MSIYWRRGGKLKTWSGDFAQVTWQASSLEETLHGRMQCASVEVPSVDSSPELRLEFMLSLDVPLFLWRLQLKNLTQRQIQIDRVELLRVGSDKIQGRRGRRSFNPLIQRRQRELGEGSICIHPSPGDLAFYTTGWQSWNFAGVLDGTMKMPRSRLGMLTKPLYTSPGMPGLKGKGAFTSDMFGVIGDRCSRNAVLIGFLSQREAFGGVEVFLDPNDPFVCLWANGDGVILDANSSYQTDWACLQWVDLDADMPLEPYVLAVARENEARGRCSAPVGWCSWYQFFQSVTQDDVLANLAWAEEHREAVPLDVIQIDDGFQAEIGDWFEIDTHAFPGGMPRLSAKIRQAGFRPGLWLAPFIVKPNSQLLKEHPDWVLRNRFGRPVNAGFVWGTLTRALDISHPKVMEFIPRLIETYVREWGYDYLKLDFLYAGALSGIRHDPTKTRAQIIHRALRSIREAAGEDVILVGCGCPLGSGIGVFDVMRIGPDVAPYWAPSYQGLDFFLKHEPSLPSTRNAVQSTLQRSFLNRRWWINDGDCLLVRDADTRLTETEVQTLSTIIAISGGALIVSDHLPTLSEERAAWLSRMIPPLQKEARVIDWFDAPQPSKLVLSIEGAVGTWDLIAIMNWEDRKRDLLVDLTVMRIAKSPPFHLFDFWRQQYERLEDERFILEAVPAHGVRLISLRSITDMPQWIGDTIHISQGLVVRRWKIFPEGLEAALGVGHRVEGEAWLQLPAEPTHVALNQKLVKWRQENEDIFVFELPLESENRLEVRWD
ncbi:MAG: hypothetical protein GTO14_02790 [Anaerolineales bacterium]|nr:hypothetical protein [Anaerolineales bacterium]